MKKLILLLLVFAVTILGCKEKELSKKKDLKVGIIYSGTITDAGWSEAHDQGIEEIRSLPYVKKILKKEDVPETSDAAKILTQMIKLGECNLIYSISFGFMDQTLKVAKQFPEVTFMQCAGYKVNPNMGNYFGRMYQAKYLAGMIAGLMTKSDKIGYVVPIPIPEVYRMVDAFALGVKSVNKEANIYVVWIGEWYNAPKEMDAAKSMIEQGCDVISQGGDSPGPQKAAEAAGVWCIGHDTDMAKYAPNSILTSAIWHWGKMYKDITQEIHKGTWTAKGPVEYWPGLKNGVIGLAPYSANVPEDVIEKVEAVKEKFLNEGFEPFVGPLYDQQGKLMVEEGKTMSAEELLRINWMLDNIKGNLK